MKRGIILALALLLIGIGISGFIGNKNEVRSGSTAVTQKASSAGIKTIHNLDKLRAKGIILAESSKQPAVTKEEAVGAAKRSVGNLDVTDAQTTVEYWDVSHVSTAGQVPQAIPCWVVSFGGLQIPQDNVSGETRSELTVFVEAMSGQVVYMLSYR